MGDRTRVVLSTTIIVATAATASWVFALMLPEESAAALTQGNPFSAESLLLFALTTLGIVVLVMAFVIRRGFRIEEGEIKGQNRYYYYDVEEGRFVQAPGIDEMIVRARENLFRFTRRNSVQRPPGLRVMGLIRLVCSTKSVERIFEPIYSDFWYEYSEALERGEQARRFFIVLRYYLALARAASLFSVVRLFQSAVEYWKTVD